MTNKPYREFWIRMGEYIGDYDKCDDKPFYSVVWDSPNHGPHSFSSEALIHVIEHAAMTDLKRENEKLRAALEQYKNRNTFNTKTGRKSKWLAADALAEVSEGKMKPRHYFCDVYKSNFLFCVGWDRKVIELYLDKEFNHKKDFDKISGLTMQYSSIAHPLGVLVWTDKHDAKYHYRSLMHECIHAALYVLDTRNVKINMPEGEALTYLAENLFYQARQL